MTPPSFNLIDQPWLPCRFRDEHRARDVSILEALTCAPEIEELSHPSPLVTVALHRLLLAIIHRVYGPSSIGDWQVLWERGAFDPEPLEVYVDSCRSRFDLFDREHPFYQLPDLPEKYATSIAKLGHAYSAGNNPILFDHTWDASPPALPVAEAARLLVAQQAFAIGGLIARLPGEPASAEASHLVKGAVCLTVGPNLYETLVLNAVRLNGREGEPFQFDPQEDRPAWEAGPARAETRPLRGYLDLLTWQPRRIRLIAADANDTISHAVIMDGFRFPARYSLKEREPMLAYTERKAPKGKDAWAPVGFRPEQALWRDSLTLLQDRDGSARPRNISWLHELQMENILDVRRAFALSAFGLSSDRAKLFLWRREDLPLPLVYLTDGDLLSDLGAGLDATNRARTALAGAVWRMAAETLGPGGTADRTRVSALLASLDPERMYWARLDLPFRSFMTELAGSYSTDRGEDAKRRWAAAIREAANRAFDAATSALETSGRGLRAAAEARPHFLAGLRRALHELEPEPSTTEAPL